MHIGVATVFPLVLHFIFPTENDRPGYAFLHFFRLSASDSSWLIHLLLLLDINQKLVLFAYCLCYNTGLCSLHEDALLHHSQPGLPIAERTSTSRRQITNDQLPFQHQYARFYPLYVDALASLRHLPSQSQYFCVLHRQKECYHHRLHPNGLCDSYRIPHSHNRVRAQIRAH